LALFIARVPLERAAAGLLAATVVVVTLIQPAAGLAVLALAIPFGSVISLPLPGLTIVDLLAGLVFVAWLARGAGRRQIRLELQPASAHDVLG
jgi:hypothetical protein